MEYWDYTVEIECLKGAQGSFCISSELCCCVRSRERNGVKVDEINENVVCIFVCVSDVEAAAELGRSLLERNRELEATVRQQQALIEDQALEMQVIPSSGPLSGAYSNSGAKVRSLKARNTGKA